MWTLEEEQALREDLIDKIIFKANDGDGMLSRAELDNVDEHMLTYMVADSRHVVFLGSVHGVRIRRVMNA